MYLWYLLCYVCAVADGVALLGGRISEWDYVELISKVMDVLL